MFPVSARRFVQYICEESISVVAVCTVCRVDWHSAVSDPILSALLYFLFYQKARVEEAEAEVKEKLD